jgi:hypothetical protein
MIAVVLWMPQDTAIHFNILDIRLASRHQSKMSKIAFIGSAYHTKRGILRGIDSWRQERTV